MNRETEIGLAKPFCLTIAQIVRLLERHFTYSYSEKGASRLPVLAIYAIYQVLVNNVARYKDAILCPLKSESYKIGDIDIKHANGRSFESFEILFGKPITARMVANAYEKFKGYDTDRYYLLTTANMDAADWESIEKEVARISQIHGCQVIVNGVYTTLKYYLRLLNDPAEFIDKYVELLKQDETVKFQHKTAWNDIISSGIK